MDSNHSFTGHLGTWVGHLAALISTWAAGGIADTNLTPAALVLRKANLASLRDLPVN